MLHYIFILRYIFFIKSIGNVDLYLIQNQNKQICANCKFFIANKNECSKFGDVDIITGKCTYETATSVRNDEDKCGEYAIFFEKNHFKFITIPYYFALDNWNSTNVILLSYFSFWVLYVLLYKSLLHV
jgi:hypothetical protein